MYFQMKEQTGVSLEKLFQKSNPFQEKSCLSLDCVVCDGKGIKCRDEGVGYRGVCKKCKSQNLKSEYVGETGKNAYTRGKQHMQGLKGKNENNAFYKHWKNFHETPGEPKSSRLENYEFIVAKTFQDPLSRQINEMVRMTHFNGHLLNSKAEWNAPPIVRIIVINESEKAKVDQRDQIASSYINSVQIPPLNPMV